MQPTIGSRREKVVLFILGIQRGEDSKVRCLFDRERRGEMQSHRAGLCFIAEAFCLEPMVG